jgi:hypothetical protein
MEAGGTVMGGEAGAGMGAGGSAKDSFASRSTASMARSCSSGPEAVTFNPLGNSM